MAYVHNTLMDVILSCYYRSFYKQSLDNRFTSQAFQHFFFAFFLLYTSSPLQPFPFNHWAVIYDLSELSASSLCRQISYIVLGHHHSQDEMPVRIRYMLPYKVSNLFPYVDKILFDHTRPYSGTVPSWRKLYNPCTKIDDLIYEL
jgi:hypothetical protein